MLINRFSGSHGVRSIEAVRSVLEGPRQTVSNNELYKDAYTKAAYYAQNIILNHPFIDGNKRTGITIAVMFLRQNKVNIQFAKKELEDFAVEIATKKLSIDDIAMWLKQHVN